MTVDIVAVLRELVQLRAIKRKIDARTATDDERERYKFSKQKAWNDAEAILHDSPLPAAYATDAIAQDELAAILVDVKTMWTNLADVAMQVPGAADIVAPRRELPEIIDMVFKQAAAACSNGTYAEQAEPADKLVRVLFRPLLVSGCIGKGRGGTPYILIDSEQSEAEQLIALWHEALHLLGLTDEDTVEAMAVALADVFPPFLTAIKAAHA